ncbi:RlpA-like double-psi beta-barrel-protein domain-containing protein-containing protein, partial [Rhizoctonia solani]
GLGSCGWQNQDYEWVAAIGTSLFQEMMVDANPNHSQACGKTATVTYGGKSITVGIVDRCYACGYNDIDLSPSAFQQFAALGEYRCDSWHYLNSSRNHRRWQAQRRFMEVQLNRSYAPYKHRYMHL